MGKRANGEGSIFKLGDGRWRAVLSVGRSTDGRRKRKSRTCMSQAAARAALEEMRNETPAAAVEMPARLTVAAYLNGWLESTISRKSENTHASYRIAVEKHILPQIGGIRIEALQPLHVQSMLDAFTRAELGDRTQQNAFTVLSTAMKRAAKLGLIRSNPCLSVERPAHKREDIRPFTAKEAKSIIKATEPHRLHALFVLAFHTGMRQAELFGLNWDRIDFEAGTLLVNQQAVDVSGKTIIRPPKSESGIRTIELPRNVLDVLNVHRAMMLKEKKAALPMVFPGRRGAYLQRGTFRTRHWTPLLKTLKLEHRGFHHVRHTYATLSLGAGVPVHVVSKILGHSKVSTTLDLYSHLLKEHQTAAGDAIAKLLG